MDKKMNLIRYVSLISVSIGSKIMLMIPYIMSVYYVVFQNATGFTNSQIGLLMTVLGISSFILWIPGGYIADRIPPRLAVPFGFIGTGLIGLYLAFYMPSFSIMLGLYIIFPIFITLFAFSSSMKAIRMLGTDAEAGKNQTIRSISIGIVSLSIAIFALTYLSTSSNDLVAYKLLISCYSIIIIVCGILFALTFNKSAVNNVQETRSIKIKDFIKVLKIKEVLLIGIFGSVVYITAISLVYVQPYLGELYNLDSAATSFLGVICRDISIISVPFMVRFAVRKKVSITKVIEIGLIITLFCFAALLFIPSGNNVLLIFSIIVFLIGAFWTMGSWILQFVPISDIKLPMEITGSAIGIISVLVHLGDIFYYSLCGMLIDQFGLSGYRYIFLITIALLIIGVVAAISVVKAIERKRSKIT